METVKKIEDIIAGYCDKVKQSGCHTDRSCLDAVDIIVKLSQALTELKKV